MRCDLHCPQPGGSLKVAAVVAVAVAVGVLWPIVHVIALVAVLTAGVLVVAGLGLLGWLLYRERTSLPVRIARADRARRRALAGERPAIATRRVVQGVVLGTADSEKVER